MVERLEASFFSRENPQWEKLGILVPAVKKDGTKVMTIRNGFQPRRAMAEAVLAKVGLADSAQRDVASDAAPERFAKPAEGQEMCGDICGPLSCSPK